MEQAQQRTVDEETHRNWRQNNPRGSTSRTGTINLKWKGLKRPTNHRYHMNLILFQALLKIYLQIFFQFTGYSYLVVCYRLSRWLEIFLKFGVSKDILSDDRPELLSSITKKFLITWVVTYQTTSAYYPRSNGKAEVSVKQAKKNSKV